MKPKDPRDPNNRADLNDLNLIKRVWDYECDFVDPIKITTKVH